MLKEKTAVLACVLASLFAFASCGPVSENTELSVGKTTESVSETAAETEETTAAETTEAEAVTTVVSETVTAETTAAEKVTEATGTKAEIKSETKADAETALDKPYAAAYTELAKKIIEENGDDVTFALIDIDGDDTPELSAGKLGYWVSLYTYADGKIHTLMDFYPYGVSGNIGYDYIPGQNYLHYSSASNAGIIRYDNYMKVTGNHELETIACIEARFFDDKNGNGLADQDELDTYTENAKYYKDGEEITAEEVASYNKGESREVAGSFTLDELINAMK